LLGGREKYPVQLTFHEDPKWKIWRNFVDALRERGVV
jgi:hypothetical protein